MATTEINTDNTPAATGSTKNDQDSPWKEALERWAELEASDNVFALVVMAQT